MEEIREQNQKLLIQSDNGFEMKWRGKGANLVCAI